MKNKFFDIVFASLILVSAIALIFLMIFFKMGYWSFMGAMIVTMSYGFINVIVLLHKVLLKYEIKRLTAAIYATLVAIGVLGYYVLTYVGHYDEARLIYWIVYGVITVLSVVILTVINFHLKPQKAVIGR